jgi:hypothetical protein
MMIQSDRTSRSRTRLLLETAEERNKTNSRNLDDLEAHTGNITLRFTLPTELFWRRMSESVFYH